MTMQLVTFEDAATTSTAIKTSEQQFVYHLTLVGALHRVDNPLIQELNDGGSIGASSMAVHSSTASPRHGAFV